MFGLSAQQAHDNAMEVLRHSEEASRWYYSRPVRAEALSDSESEVEDDAKEN